MLCLEAQAGVAVVDSSTLTRQAAEEVSGVKLHTRLRRVYFHTSPVARLYHLGYHSARRAVPAVDDKVVIVAAGILQFSDSIADDP